MVSTIFERVSNKPEITTAAEAGEYDYAFMTPQYEVALLQWKNDDSLEPAKVRLSRVLELLEGADFSTTDSIKSVIWPYAEEVGKGEVLWPLRVALSGQERSPDPFTLAFILGKDESLSRIQAACDKITL